MHLSDDEILELTYRDHHSNEHLAQCKRCQLRLAHRLQFQEKLSLSYQSAEFNPKWDSLREELTKIQQGQHHQQMEFKIKKLQWGLIALAACFCLVIMVPILDTSQSIQTIETELASVIDENHQLQRSVELFSPYGTFQTVAIQSLKIRLQQLDSEIQLSYLEGMPKPQKLKLWQFRKQLLIKSIEELNTNSANHDTKSI